MTSARSHSERPGPGLQPSQSSHRRNKQLPVAQSSEMCQQGNQKGRAERQQEEPTDRTLLPWQPMLALPASQSVLIMNNSLCQITIGRHLASKL